MQASAGVGHVVQRQARIIALSQPRGKDGSTGSDLAFSNLDLEVWSVDEAGQFVSKIGDSMSTYNNTEMLRFDWLDAGRYGFKVNFENKVFDTTNAVNSEYFGLAWSTTAVPPTTT